MTEERDYEKDAEAEAKQILRHLKAILVTTVIVVVIGVIVILCGFDIETTIGAGGFWLVGIVFWFGIAATYPVRCDQCCKPYNPNLFWRDCGPDSDRYEMPARAVRYCGACRQKMFGGSGNGPF